MMNLNDLINRQPIPLPWQEGDKIPWDDPDFSERMLREHLSQVHDAASRTMERIDQQVAWIQNQLLPHAPAKVLDLGCGPGLYTERLAALGHICTGIDFSPASIEYARQQAADKQLNVEYHLENILTADFGENFDLVMFIFGEFNTFRQPDALFLLQKARGALKKEGSLLIEAHPFSAIYNESERTATWQTRTSGLYSEKPYLSLQENIWQESSQTLTTRYYVVDAETGEITRHAQTLQAYADEAYERLFKSAGFTKITRFASLIGEVDVNQPDQCVFVAQG